MNKFTVKTGWLWLAGFLVIGLAGPGRSQPGGVQNPDSAVQRCATVAHEQLLRQRNPGRAIQLDALNRLVQRAVVDGASARNEASDEIYRIPVVVHVIHSTADGTIGGINNANISADQIATQIQVLNEDYRRQAGTNGYNTETIGADARIEFFLATIDPNGQPTTGITRHYYAQKTSFDVYSTDDVLLSQIAYWPTDRYLNLWVAPLQNRILGYGQFPTAVDTLQGLVPIANEQTDGVIVDYRYFGRQTGAVTSTTYNLGRTLTHEIGHWLGLIHPNGDGDGCNEDYVADTPPTKDLNNTTQCTQTYSTCVNGVRTRDLIEDYMMYSPDRCMNLFTKGQVDRMRAVIALSPRRLRVVQSLAPLAETPTLTLTVYPNPIHLQATADVQFMGSQTITATLFDLTGRPVKTYQYANVTSTRISLIVSDVPVGMYVLRVTTGSETKAKRVFIQ